MCEVPSCGSSILPQKLFRFTDNYPNTQGYLTVITTATLASIGTAGVPSVGLITLSMVFASVGLPVEAIAMIMGIDRILDMARTMVNITGDAMCTVIVANQDGALNRDVFNSK